ncbi:YdcF family protein [Echinicola soli]|uniref:YdcF family protein n=1 Tax=Echinicola soli TaxID=2591634 RepID=A0A514CMN2_9BACT|nr:YdcF family protein [Echinicola soli]QDH81017.1 YdcF family protein [Echinicola soli]
MFFYLAQFLTFLAMPLTLVIICLILGILWRKNKKGTLFGGIGLVLLLFFCNTFISNTVMYLWEPTFKPIAPLPTYEFGIVLTGVTNLDKTAYDRTFFKKGADRVTQAVQLYKMNKIKKILITGGQGLTPTNSNTEAALLADFMKIAGVPKKDIIVEDQAVNTRQNALFTGQKLTALEIDPKSTHLLITSAFHMKRAKACFDKVGVSTATFPVDYYASDIKADVKSLIIPSPEGLVIWHKLFKEWIGLTVYKLVGYI